MKKILAIVLASVMVLSVAACSPKNAAQLEAAAEKVSEAAENAEMLESAADVISESAVKDAVQEVAAAVEQTVTDLTTDPDTIPDTMTTDDGKYEIAFVTDVGQLKDKSFNQGTYNGVKLFANAQGVSYKYYQPANAAEATDDDRYDAMKSACEAGAKAVVCAGFLQATALEKAAKEFPDVKFIFIDGWNMGLENLAGICFKEEQCGYFAGYGAVKDGFEKLGFMGGGGGTNPACCRYGYGFAQGVNAAAEELGKKVELNYSWEYGASYSASPELQAMAEGWYQNGTEIIFVCGGSMFQSVAAAASANDGFVIGVDSDQSGDSETVITSAMKGIDSATFWALNKVYDGTWSEISDQTANLGADVGATGLPVADASWRFETYTKEEYLAQLASVVSGELKIDNDYEKFTGDLSNTKVNFQ